jgi:hypothetical protein
MCKSQLRWYLDIQHSSVIWQFEIQAAPLAVLRTHGHGRGPRSWGSAR